MNARACTGCLVGGAVGDSLGLPYEGLGPRRARRLFPGPPEHHLLPRRGMVSDDTEHACFTARALMLSRGDVDVFGRELASSLRWWLAALPAGIGYATLRAILKSCVGFAPQASGVHSAGNGPAMRSAILGVALADDRARMAQFVRRSTRLTHTDPRAYHGALAAALAASWSARGVDVDAASFIDELASMLRDEDASELLRALNDAAKPGPIAAPKDGISGYMLHTVPAVLHAWFRHHDDFAAGLAQVVEAGGDTDTAGAIFGGIVGARVGVEGIPARWRDGIVEWPRSLAWMCRLGEALAAGATKPPPYAWWGVWPRNLAFLVVVLAHGFRRLAPPY